MPPFTKDYMATLESVKNMSHPLRVYLMGRYVPIEEGGTPHDGPVYRTPDFRTLLGYVAGTEPVHNQPHILRGRKELI